MDRPSLPELDGSRLVWPVGRVSEMLGIPAVTLRSWERRYGVGPSERSAGQHRRYSQDDVDRLRRMQLLIGQGTSAVDAARLSQSRRSGTGAEPTVDALLTAAESFRLAEVDELLDKSFASGGASGTWNELVSPAYRRLGRRFDEFADCTDIEIMLADAVEKAVERYVNGRELRREGNDPVLLVCCPGERHTLPMIMLQAVLLERSQPALLLGPDANPPAVVSAAERTAPSTVVLWALRRQAGQAELRRQLLRLGYEVETAGPGWTRSLRTLSEFSEAAEALTTRRPVAQARG